MNEKTPNSIATGICQCINVEHSVFGFLGEENAQELCAFFECKTFSEGEILWTEGSPCEYVAIIVSGRVELKKETEFEGKHVVVGVIGSGSVVGSLCILDGQPRAVTAEALEDLTLLTITNEKIEELLRVNPEAGVKLLKGILMSVSYRLRRCFDRLTKFF